jgi:predicted TIM-barrel fold metal-dependent hydrolase
VQIYAPLPVVVAHERAIARMKRPVVLDHFGGARTGHAGTAEGLRTLMRLTREGPAWVKLSGAYRVSLDRETMWNDAAPLAVALTDRAPKRLVWGSDWPHTGGHDRKPAAAKRVERFQAIDDRASLAALADWCGDEETLKRLLVKNPAKLYGF